MHLRIIQDSVRIEKPFAWRSDNAPIRKWRAVSPIDDPQMFNVFLTYDLPFGRKRPFGTNRGCALDTLAGGWTLVFLTHY